MHYKLGSTTLSHLAFSGESDPSFPREKSDFCFLFKYELYVAGANWRYIRLANAHLAQREGGLFEITPLHTAATTNAREETLSVTRTRKAIN